MAASKQSKRRKLAKLRSAFHGQPLALDVRAFGRIEHAIESGDLDAIKASLEFGTEIESISKIVNGIAVIPITGVLRDEVDWMVRWYGASSYQLIERDFRQAIDNESVRGVLFYCSSPGGAAIGCKRVADTIYEARGIKPIRCYVQGVCGSAAFYLATACDRIEATADSLVGSVGTIFPHMEASKAFEDFGMRHTVFTNTDSPKKGHGNIYEPLTDDAKETLQTFVNSYGRSFVEDVARYRGVAPAEVVNNFGQGDAMRADVAIGNSMIDAVVAGFNESLESISSVAAESTPVTETESDETPVVTGQTINKGSDKMNERIKAQLYALGLIDSLEASDAECLAALRGWFAAQNKAMPAGEEQRLVALQTRTVAAQGGEGDEEEEDKGDDEDDSDDATNRTQTLPASNVQQAHNTEMGEARLADLRAAADLVNSAAGYNAVSSEMVLDAFSNKLDANKAMAKWNEQLAANEPSVPTMRIRGGGQGADQYAEDVIDAMVYRCHGGENSVPLSDGAANLVNRPLWAVAAECLQMAGHQVDMYGDRELIAQQAMVMGDTHSRHTFFSANENRQYIQAASVPHSRPGDFPNILSGLANKFLDTIELDDDYSYPLVSAVLPGGLSDFKPAMMVNKGIVEELDELQDSEQFKQLGVAEEVLSYLFLRRFGNKFGWTPVMIANDDLGAFAEGMIGLQEAWEVTQNRLVVDRFTSTETLLDGNALFANRADTGTGNVPAANDNDRTGGGAPSDAEWGAMETLYADIGGIDTGRRVRGALNVCFCPTGASSQEARRTFLTFPTLGESKEAATTANIGLYRGSVAVIPESELRVNSATTWYGLRNPTRLNTATVVRGYFNGFGTAGRRERWYDPENKTTFVSIEGRIAVATKNWRYAVRNVT